MKVYPDVMPNARRIYVGGRAKWELTCPICSEDEFVKAGLCTGKFIRDDEYLREKKKFCRCAKNYQWTEQQRIYQILKICKEEGLVFDQYDHPNRQVSLICPEHLLFKKDVFKFINESHKCPSCVKYGFNVRAGRAFLYVLRSNDGAFNKVGIAKNPSSRIDRLRKKTPFAFSVAAIFSGTGDLVRQAERKAHQFFTLAGFEGFDGCREWVRVEDGIEEWLLRQGLDREEAP